MSATRTRIGTEERTYRAEGWDWLRWRSSPWYDEPLCQWHEGGDWANPSCPNKPTWQLRFYQGRDRWSSEFYYCDEHVDDPQLPWYLERQRQALKGTSK